MGLIIKLLTVLVVAAVILGGGGYFAYELYFKPAKLDRLEEIEMERLAALPPPPHPGIAAFEEILPLRYSDDLESARESFQTYLKDFPDSPKAMDARFLLGEIQADLLLSTRATPDKEVYTVVRGDSLAGIAAKKNSTVELIMRANNLLGHNLSIGQTLLIPQPDPTILIDPATSILEVWNDGEFFKQYPILSFRVPGDASGMATEVVDKLAMKGNTRVAFGGADYTGSDRWIMLGRGITIRAMPESGAGGEAVAIPAGIVLSRADVEEIFALVRRGTPVTIQ